MTVLVISPIRRSSDLNGLLNGKIPPSKLTVFPSPGHPDIRLLRTAGRAFAAMRAAAAKDGIALNATNLTDSYRPYDVQERIFRQRYTTTPNGTRGRLWEGRLWYKRPGVAAAAVPGTSNHGWAQAVDFVTVPGFVTWMLKNAGRFGWSWEIQSEDWHLHYFAGDTIPPAVIAFETPKAKDPFMALTDAEQKEMLEHLRHLDPWPPEKLNSSGKADLKGKPAAKHLRWISETVDRVRDLGK